MNRRACLVIASMCIASWAWAAAPAKNASSPAVAKSTAKRPASAARSGAAKAQAKKSAGTTSAKSGAPGAKATGREAPRTLQDIHIEGEIPVPQVLFITARDQRRFLDFQHRRYLKTSQQVGEQTALPSWIGVTGQQPTDARKENPR